MAREWCRQSISMIHLHVLLLLDTDGPLSMSRLAENVDVSLPSATGIVSRMEERGLLRRIHGEDDRRLVMVQLTDGGRAALEKADYFRRQHITRAVGTLSESQLTNLLRAVRDLRAGFERAGQPAPDGAATTSSRTSTTSSTASTH
jgi:DNA-binding MarR family transcriptional regulator